MTIQNKPRRNVWLNCWQHQHDEIPNAFFEVSTSALCRSQGVTKVVVLSSSMRVTAFCDYLHGDEYLTKDELELCARAYITGDINITEIDFTK
jgi:hypothetical protein